MKINLRLLRIYLAKIYPRYNLASIIKFLVHRAHAPHPYGTEFFHFCIHFCQKVPTSEVHAPLTGPRLLLREILDPPLHTHVMIVKPEWN